MPSYALTPGYFKSGASASAPDLAELVSNGHPTAGDSLKAIDATVPGAGWYFLIDQMRVGLIALSGRDPANPPTAIEWFTALQSFDWTNDGTLKGATLVDLTVTTAKLAAKAVTGDKIADATITGSKLTSKTITSTKIADATITSTQLAANSVTVNKLASDAVTTGKIYPKAVTAAKIADLTITAAQIADATITFAKMSEDSIATEAQAIAGTATDVLMTPYLVAKYFAAQPSIPPGTISFYAGTSVPDGYLIANGATVSRTTYAALFAAIGTKYGSGNGSTTFGLPNLADRFPEGTTSTSSVGTYVSAGLPNITGYTGGAADDFVSTSGAFYRAESGCEADNGNWGTFHAYLDASRSSSVYGNSSTVQPPALKLLPLIKF
ncbi:phage tail protein [Sutterella sp.]|uniref:phage tail protein n=1 Tax=Sutterella sp. TaxID=1981025 RepID=UPI0026E0B8BC|nr:phage tail protein [Sutterella sp.]MDO5531433.1 phage tail protein [Sutterella sp.]